MEKWPTVENVDGKKDDLDLQKEKEIMTQSIDAIKNTEIFPKGYLDNVEMAVFEGNVASKIFQSGEIEEVGSKKLWIKDYLYGKKTDFAQVYFEKYFKQFFNKEKFLNSDDRHFLPLAFLEGSLEKDRSYKEFLAHELAHHLLDEEYLAKFGKLEDEGEVMNFSSEYNEKFKSKIKSLLSDIYPGLDIDRFDYSRFSISEVFAYLYEREYCKRANDNFEIHAPLKDRVDSFMSNPKKSLENFNEKYSRNCSLDDLYQENHILSYIAAPIIEEKYPKFEDRINFFWE